MKIVIPLFIFLISISNNLMAQKADIAKDAFAHTYSIVARDSITGEMAVGVQSHWFSVGSLVSWGKSGVGVVATQSFVNPAFGPNGLRLLENGETPTAALELLIEDDSSRDYRQVALLNMNGESAAYTGKKNIAEASHVSEKNFSVQANMMLNDSVVPAMAKAFKANAHLPLAERVVEVLKAAQQVGGDIRGKQSAALIVVGPEKVKDIWNDKKIDLRVDDHSNPLIELERLLKTARAYEYMNMGDVAMEENNVPEALMLYGKAETLFPDNLEMKYWKAVAMANSGKYDEALKVFKAIFKDDDNWRILTMRLPASGLLDIPEDELERIIN